MRLRSLCICSLSFRTKRDLITAFPTKCDIIELKSRSHNLDLNHIRKNTIINQCFALTAYMPMCLHAYTLTYVHAYMHVRTCFTLICFKLLGHDSVSTCLRTYMLICDPYLITYQDAYFITISGRTSLTGVTHTFR